MFNSQKFALRTEYFGGLLIDRVSGTRYQLSPYDNFFLELLRLNRSIDFSNKLVNDYFHVNYEPDIDLFTGMNVISDDMFDSSNETLRGPYTSVDAFVKDFESVRNCNYLRVPLELSFFPTNLCNCHCDFCFLGEKLSLKYSERGAQDWLELAKSFIREGTISFSILGGEPLLYKDVCTLLSLMNEESARVNITSNGQLWRTEHIELISSLDNISPTFSIEYLNSSLNNLSMGGKSSVDKTISVIRELYRRGKRSRLNAVNVGIQN